MLQRLTHPQFLFAPLGASVFSPKRCPERAAGEPRGELWETVNARKAPEGRAWVGHGRPSGA